MVSIHSLPWLPSVQQYKSDPCIDCAKLLKLSKLGMLDMLGRSEITQRVVTYYVIMPHVINVIG